MRYFLAVDIGASSGRHILGYIKNGQMYTEEIYRFPNSMEYRDGFLCWDTAALFRHILAGMKKCCEIGKTPSYVGIDTWAVDFALIDSKGEIIGNTVGYRDSRTAETGAFVYKTIDEKKLYARTGIQKQMFNTIYQLMAVKTTDPEALSKASSMLLIPDYFNFLLTGKIACEYTNATTTQLVSPKTKDWDYELIDLLGYPRKIFARILPPGTFLGRLLPDIAAHVGFDCTVVLPATHDTGSAVVAVPSASDETLYISSGTWSLMGVELHHADCSEYSMEHNFTNEGGYEFRFRYLKNIMGLWMIQSVRKELDNGYSFEQLCNMAEMSNIPSIVDCNDSRFLAPSNMAEAVRKACAESGQPVPETPGELARVIYRSLAKCYADTAVEIEAVTGKHYSVINILGGGSNADFLNRITADFTGKSVLAGPSEATSIGNLAVQMIAAGELSNLTDARACIARSFKIKKY